jgi:glycerol-3-phosphate acyltransferase PlsY
MHSQPSLSWIPALSLGVALGFLLGSVPFGFLWVKLRTGEDVRSFGSGNVGATNVGRVLGRKAGLGVLLADALKGLVAVLLAAPIGAAVSAGAAAPAAAAVGAVAGHCYSPWLRGRGGKGVATMFGAFAVLAPVCAAIAAMALAALAAGTRTMSAGSLAAAFALTLSSWWLGLPMETTVAALLSAILVIWRHKENIGRLCRGEEHRFGEGRPE